MSDDLSRCIQRAALESGADLQTARQIEDYFTSVWGGLAIYVRKPKAHESTKAVAISRAVASGASIAAACSELGISRSTAYRLRKEAREGAIAESDVSR